MKIQNLPVAAIILITALGVSLGCKRSAESRAQDATSLIRSMHNDLLGAQKKVIAEFKLLPEADAIKINLEKNIDGWAVSEKNLSSNEEIYEKAIISYQKDAKEDALIGELRLYAKKMAKNAQDLTVDFEGREIKVKKELAAETVEELKTIRTQVLKLLPLQIEFEKESQRIATEYETKLAKLLG